VSWQEVAGVLSEGGTVIGTARCKEFRTREGRLKAVFNLVSRGIDAIIVIGGDGSLTGADILRQEWPGLLKDLVSAGTITAKKAAEHPVFAVVGLVGSIDNDMNGTTITIGANTALHRAIEAIDSLASTAASHQRCFVVEIMVINKLNNFHLAVHLNNNPGSQLWMAGAACRASERCRLAAHPRGPLQARRLGDGDVPIAAARTYFYPLVFLGGGETSSFCCSTRARGSAS